MPRGADSYAAALFLPHRDARRFDFSSADEELGAGRGRRFDLGRRVIEQEPVRPAAEEMHARGHRRHRDLRLGGELFGQGVGERVLAEHAAVGDDAGVELALDYGGGGTVRLESLQDGMRKGLRRTFEDQGPGIPDVERALRDGYSTYQGLGLGLPGARRLMDEFALASETGRGTTVTMTKWRGDA